MRIYGNDWKRFRSIRSLICQFGWTREQIEAFQSNQLKTLVRHACENVPYYRRLFKRHGITADGISGLQDLKSIPTTEKRDLVNCSKKDLLTVGVTESHLLSRSTNGSTGEPFHFFLSAFEDDLLSAFRLRILLRLGMKVTDRQVRIRLPHVKQPGKTGSFLRSLGLFQIENISSLNLPEEALIRLRQIRPQIISGLTGMVYQIALLMDGEQRKWIQPRFVFAGGDTLTSNMRRRIEEGFGTRVLESYASHEFNMIGWECPETRALHVSEASVLVEILDGNRPVNPGEKGEVVVTALHSFTQPFIRYRLGDIATRGENSCSCGLPFSTIRSVEGRILDRLLYPGGKMVSPDTFFLIIEETALWVRQYQLTQENRQLIRIRIVPFQHPTTQQLTELNQNLSKEVPEQMRLEIRVVEQIPPGPGGKYRVSRNRVISNYLPYSS